MVTGHLEMRVDIDENMSVTGFVGIVARAAGPYPGVISVDLAIIRASKMWQPVKIIC